jgi:hypothetical protein
MAVLMQVVPDIRPARTGIRAAFTGVTFSVHWRPVVAIISLAGAGTLPVLLRAS